jgi:hypothetical protein
MKKLLKRIKISKTTAIIGSVLTVLVAAPLIYFFVLDKPEVKSWYSNDWLYRKAITVNNPGSTLIDEDVLIEIDTQSLISSGKLQSDCDDLRLVDNDDTTILNYWIEGGCNTTTTQVWVRIPSLTSGNYIIYSYYGNSTAINGEESWSGSFYTLSESSCSNGWTRDANFDNRFIMGSTTSGSTGGTSGIHGGTFSAKSTEGSLVAVGNQPNQYYCLAGNDHTHSVTGTLSNGDSTPPYLSTVVCSKDRLTTLDNMIMVSDTSTPTGWTRVTALDGVFPLGSDTYGTTGGAVSHSHDIVDYGVQPASTSNCQTFETPGMSSVEAALSTHTHTVSAVNTESDQNNYPPYIQLLYVKAPSSLSTLNQQVIVMTSAVPPLGWNQYTSANGNFVMGSASINTSVLGSTEHADSFDLDLSSGSTSLFDYSDIWVPGQHRHRGDIVNSNIPPYRSVIYAKRKATLVNTVGVEEMTNLAPSAPTDLLTEGQINPTDVTDDTPEFSAIFNDPNIVDTAVYYEIQVVRSSEHFTSGPYIWTTLSPVTPINVSTRSPDISYAGNPLEHNGVPYLWRIRFVDNYGAIGEWSAAAEFTLPLLSSPPQATGLLTEGETTPNNVTDTTPEFSAIYNDTDPGDTATDYQIQVSESSDFTGTLLWDSGKTAITPIASGERTLDISYAGDPLTTNATQYRWRIRFWDSTGQNGTWSSTASFRIAGPPNSPILTQIDGKSSPATITISNPTFSSMYTDFNLDNGIYYEIEVNTSSDFTGDVMWDTGKTSISPISPYSRSPEIQYAGLSFTPQATYYWRMRFWDALDQVGQWTSPTDSFTVDIVGNTNFEAVGLEGININ